MKSWITTIIVGALAGAAGAMLALEMLPERTYEPIPKQSTLLGPEAELPSDPEVGARIEELERRLATLELRPETSSREVVVSAPTTERPALELATTGEGTVAALSDPILQDHVELALERIREDERLAREQEKELKRQEQLDRQLEKLSDALGLGNDQVNDMRTLYEEQRTAKQDLRRMWEDGFDDETLGQMKQDNAARYRSELERILSPQQLEDFDRIANDKRSWRNNNRRDLSTRRAAGK